MMKNILNYLYLALGSLALFSCDFSDNVEQITTNSGTADFSNYVALGNSLTAGFQDGALYKKGQENSYPAMIAKGMELDYEFTQPLMSDNLGGIPTVGIPNKYVLSLTTSGLAPTRALGTGTSTLVNIYKSDLPFHNFGVPGAKLAHLLAPGYGNPLGLLSATANPYYVRFASSPKSSVLEDALKTRPTFFSLWIGNNDVLGYALSGGNDSTPPTSSSAFAQYYELLVNKLTGIGAKGVIANIPHVSTIPFFTTVPNNALELDKTTATSLTQFFTAVEGILTQSLIAQDVEAKQAQTIASQYAITFTKGNNRFLLKTEVTGTNPLGFRQMSEEELLLLTIDRNAMANQGYGSVSISDEVRTILSKLASGNMITATEGQKILEAINPIKDADVLDVEELALIKNSVDAYNTTIKQLAMNYNLAFVDMNALMHELKTTGLRINGVNYSSTFVTGGVFSLDGVHPNQRGYAIIANEFIDAINGKYGSSISKVDSNSYTGVVFP